MIAKLRQMNRIFPEFESKIDTHYDILSSKFRNLNLQMEHLKTKNQDLERQKKVIDK